MVTFLQNANFFSHCKCLLKLEFTFTKYGEHINRALLYVKSLVRNFCKGLSVNWSVSKQYMDFLHSLWACSKRLSFVGFCPVVLFFSSFGPEGRYFVGLPGARYRGGTAMRTSTCGTVMLVCATILGPITIVFLAVSFATDYWLEFKVDPGYTRLSTDNARVSHTRHRGIFRECYPGNDTACEYLFSGI